MSENKTESYPALGSREEAEIIASFGQADIAEFFDHPIWKHVHRTLWDRKEAATTDLLCGDIAVHAQGKTGQIYRSDEGLRGGLIELAFVLAIPVLVDEDAQVARKMLEEEKEREDDDG